MIRMVTLVIPVKEGRHQCGNTTKHIPDEREWGEGARRLVRDFVNERDGAINRKAGYTKGTGLKESEVRRKLKRDKGGIRHGNGQQKVCPVDCGVRMHQIAHDVVNFTRKVPRFLRGGAVRCVRANFHDEVHDGAIVVSVGCGYQGGWKESPPDGAHLSKIEIWDRFKFSMGVELKVVEGFEVRFFGTANLPLLHRAGGAGCVIRNFAKPPLTHPGWCPQVLFCSETSPPRV